MRRIVVVVVGGALAAGVVAGCGDSSGTAVGTPEEPRRIDIELADFVFDPDITVVRPGETVEFVVTNNGAVVHEFIVTDQHGIDEHIAGGHAAHEGDMSGEGMSEGEMDEGETDMAAEFEHKLDVEPGATETLTVTFPSSGDELSKFVCLIPGHYEAGMVGEITISA